MKKIILFIFIFKSLILLSQIQINDYTSNDKFFKFKEYKGNSLKLLKTTRTIFVYRKCDEENLKQFKETLQNSWSLTDLEFVSYEEYINTNYDETYSFFTLIGLSHFGDLSSLRLYLSLWMNKNGSRVQFAKAEMYITYNTYVMTSGFYDNNLKKVYLYTDIDYDGLFINSDKGGYNGVFNWSAHSLSNILKNIENGLKSKKVKILFEKIQDSSLKELNEKTLYIPDYVLVKFNKISGNESERHVVSDLMINYKYKYKIISNSDLNDLIFNNPNESFFILYTVKSVHTHHLSIFDSKNGSLIYFNSRFGYNLNSSRFARISKLIDEFNK